MATPSATIWRLFVLFSLLHLQSASSHWCFPDIRMTPASNADGKDEYIIPYGNPLEVTCSGADAEKLRMKLDYEHIPTEQVNETTIRWFKGKPELKTWDFQCIEIGTECEYIHTISILIVPQMQIVSPHIRRGRDIIMQYGDPLEIHCSGPDSGSLSMTNSIVLQNLQTQTINTTAIKYVINKPDMQEMPYFCYSGYTSYSMFGLIVDAPPEVVGFRCISHNRELLNCSWTALSDRIEFYLYFTLFENMFHEDPILICKKLASSAGTRFCTWFVSDDPSYPSNVKTLRFLMKACNDLGCSNRTIDIEHCSIVKHNPPTDLELENKTSRSVSITWGSYESKVTYKLRYWFSGTPLPLRDVDTSSLACNYGSCRIDIDLPCPGKYYKLWVRMRPITSTGEEFWSEPAYLSFSTNEAGDNPVTADPICDWEPKETKEVMAYLINKLKKEVRNVMLARKAELVALQMKVAKIREMEEDLKTSPTAAPVDTPVSSTVQ